MSDKDMELAQSLLPHFIKYAEDISLSDEEALTAKELHLFFFANAYRPLITVKDIENVKVLAKKSVTVNKLKREYDGLPGYIIYELITEGETNEYNN